MSEDHTNKAKLYRSALTSKPIAMRDTRVIIVSKSEIPRREPFNGIIEPANLNDPGTRKAIEAINIFFWASVEQEVFGRTYNIFDCENFIARANNSESCKSHPEFRDLVGQVAIKEEKGFLHIVVLHVCPEWHGRGIGKMLVNRAVDEARKRGFKSVKLGTTNDNIPALYFYQRLGFVIEKIVPDVVADDDHVPQSGFAGLPVRDEIQMKLDLD